MRRISRKLKAITADLLEVPQDVVFDLPRLTMIGDRQLYIENHRGVLAFSEEQLLLQLVSGQLEVSGRSLVIRAILSEEVFIEGQIRGVRLLD